MAVPKILAFAGSTRSASFNKKLIKLAAAAARDAGAEVTELDLRDVPLPLYDGDLEEKDGLPANAKKLKELFLAHQALLIASPEYNSSLSAVLKNTIDWVSRPVKGEAPLAQFTGKVAGIMSASPGALGGLRGLVHLRSILGNIGVLLIPEQVAIMRAHEAFDDQGKLKDAKLANAVKELAGDVVEVTRKLMA